MPRSVTLPKARMIEVLANEFGTLPLMAATPVTLPGSGQLTIPLEIDLNADAICPVVHFDVNLKLTAPSGDKSKVLDNIRTVTVEHSAFRDPVTGAPKVYTLDTSTLEDGALLAVALLSDTTTKVTTGYSVKNDVVQGQPAGSEQYTKYSARFAIPFKLPAGHLKITLNCQDINYKGDVLDVASRAGYIVAPRRQVNADGAYIACDSKRVAGLSTYRFPSSAEIFAVVARASVEGGILDRTGSGQPAQVSKQTLTQTTQMVEYYSEVLSDTDLELAICADSPDPSINRSTPMTLSLFRFDTFY